MESTQKTKPTWVPEQSLGINAAIAEVVEVLERYEYIELARQHPEQVPADDWANTRSRADNHQGIAIASFTEAWFGLVQLGRRIFQQT